MDLFVWWCFGSFVGSTKTVSLWSEIVAYGFDKHPPHAQFLSVHVVPLRWPLPAPKLLFRELSYWFV